MSYDVGDKNQAVDVLKHNHFGEEIVDDITKTSLRFVTWLVFQELFLM